ncbi:transcription elongation factor GreA [Candidatus Roizmanbacteria bacterium CG2_30_33_16]|uniref:Transcription elongation factor GreA n=4 Tax=Candidatus Roizmaniibacteriota TaxID=1752723 RepID=A0A2H0C2B6_9BACT|nr:transcription elongation factor GreA [Candidatus Roizmanbacteria bacterium]OIP82615.1 MAG: transcription elongation factor GreA [Candidatus Roizmanbacteria bacterium CG2_30_33_16]PIP64065.1 MAG: transcription elongation factor GreA [Candidatus Roizmanbacteria bacterium CG22_combo_CG10-13_8_21_14_all_33_16]PIX69709.1 MAG: transcription elongation factor GreA [Candidatus Roizmanbacteria bacterium CG_4_10_14_3_um_filter_33_21]PJB87740.1 MAG: transcription elongation factor GreA [Candidatus Roiz
MNNKVQLTKTGFEKLQSDLNSLKKTGLPEAINRLQKARSMGDLKENSEYSAAKENLAFVENRVAELEQMIQQAEVIDIANDNNTISLGKKFIAIINREEKTITIVGEYEADPVNGKYSVTSPIGKALLGKKVGDSVEINIPAGKITYKIVSLQ